MSSIFKIDQLVDKLADYVKVKLDIIKLDLVEEGSGFIIKLLSLVVIASLSLLVIFFAALGVVILINHWLQSDVAGYFIISVCFGLILVIFLILFKNGILQSFISKQLKQHSDQKKTEE